MNTNNIKKNWKNTRKMLKNSFGSINLENTLQQMHMKMLFKNMKKK